MDHRVNQADVSRSDVTQLAQELEQATVALEDTHAQIAALHAEQEKLTQERDALRRMVSAQEARRQQTEAAAGRAREQAALAAATAAELAQRRYPPEAEELRQSLEEVSVLAEELQQANEALQDSNVALDQRVEERTRDLDAAKRALVRLNAELSHRVETETAARAGAQAELFKLQKLDAIGQLTGGVAHDFNNLLTVIINGLQVMGNQADVTKRDRIRRRIEEAAWRGAHLTQRLLAFARRQALHPERLELARHMDTVRDLLSHALRDDIDLRIDIDAALWPVEADVAALELALLNLAVNARDAMPQGGTLVLSAVNRTLEGRPAMRLELTAGDYVEIGVVDNGVGMSAEVLDRVFEPFFTTKGSDKGTGLGLAQVYGFARQSGGAAYVESRRGEGTAVRILLPRSLRPAVHPADEPGNRPQRRPAGPLHTLVVEDDDNVAATVVDMLAQLGHSSIRVSTVAAALAALSGGDPIDLVFSDVLLPGGGSGLDLAREIGRRRIGVPMILTSGYGGGVTQRLATANLPFLRKPYHLEALRQAIDDSAAG